ncbi:hypothetical protein GEMRC1_011622 [Eukaryota sp. GEM-RC1]
MGSILYDKLSVCDPESLLSRSPSEFATDLAVVSDDVSPYVDRILRAYDLPSSSHISTGITEILALFFGVFDGESVTYRPRFTILSTRQRLNVRPLFSVSDVRMSPISTSHHSPSAVSKIHLTMSKYGVPVSSFDPLLQSISSVMKCFDSTSQSLTSLFSDHTGHKIAQRFQADLFHSVSDVSASLEASAPESKTAILINVLYILSYVAASILIEQFLSQYSFNCRDFSASFISSKDVEDFSRDLVFTAVSKTLLERVICLNPSYEALPLSLCSRHLDTLIHIATICPTTTAQFNRLSHRLAREYSEFPLFLQPLIRGRAFDVVRPLLNMSSGVDYVLSSVSHAVTSPHMSTVVDSILSASHIYAVANSRDPRDLLQTKELCSAHIVDILRQDNANALYNAHCIPLRATVGELVAYSTLAEEPSTRRPSHVIHSPLSLQAALDSVPVARTPLNDLILPPLSPLPNSVIATPSPLSSLDFHDMEVSSTNCQATPLPTVFSTQHFLRRDQSSMTLRRRQESIKSKLTNYLQNNPDSLLCKPLFETESSKDLLSKSTPNLPALPAPSFHQRFQSLPVLDSALNLHEADFTGPHMISTASIANFCRRTHTIPPKVKHSYFSDLSSSDLQQSFKDYAATFITDSHDVELLLMTALKQVGSVILTPDQAQNLKQLNNATARSLLQRIQPVLEAILSVSQFPSRDFPFDRLKRDTSHHLSLSTLSVFNTFVRYSLISLVNTLAETLSITAAEPCFSLTCVPGKGIGISKTIEVCQLLSDCFTTILLEQDTSAVFSKKNDFLKKWLSTLQSFSSTSLAAVTVSDNLYDGLAELLASSLNNMSHFVDHVRKHTIGYVSSSVLSCCVKSFSSWTSASVLTATAAFVSSLSKHIREPLLKSGVLETVGLQTS